MKKNSVSISLAVIALALLCAAVTPAIHAQALAPGGGGQAALQNGVYTWPQAGFSFTVPPLWLRSGYRWTEYWGPNANGIQGARYVNEWLYTPVTPGAREQALLTIVVYDKAAWDAIVAQGGPLPTVVGEANNLVYTVRTPQSDPFPSGSLDSQRFTEMYTALRRSPTPITILGASSQPTAPTSPSPVLSKASLQNATYRVWGVPSGYAALVNGAYRAPAAPGSASEVVVTLTDTYAVGTLNGAPAAAVVLTVSGGGSGTFYYLAVVTEQGGQPVNVATTILGDRVKINGVSITNNQVVVDLVTQGPNDPMVAPTQRQIVKYELQGDKLVSVS